MGIDIHQYIEWRMNPDKQGRFRLKPVQERSCELCPEDRGETWCTSQQSKWRCMIGPNWSTKGHRQPFLPIDVEYTVSGEEEEKEEEKLQ